MTMTEVKMANPKNKDNIWKILRTSNTLDFNAKKTNAKKSKKTGTNREGRRQAVHKHQTDYVVFSFLFLISESKQHLNFQMSK